MAGSHHLVFYSDAAVYGGHEKMTVGIIRQLASREGLRITVLASESNRRLLEDLASVGPRVSVRPIPCVSKPTGWLRLPFELPQAQRVSRLLRDLAPTRYIVFAGSIDSCLKGIYAGKFARLPVIMYLPQAHRASFLGSKLGRGRDVIQDFFYRRVDFWITISRGMAEVLASHGIPPSTIRVVYNGVDLAALTRHGRRESRTLLGLPEDAYLIGNVGRFDFYVKNQPLVLSALSRHRDRLRGSLVLFVGDGPDGEALEESIRKLGLSDVARVIPWQADMSRVYSAIDMLLIASRVEGMPLVMLEAMHYGVPIISSDVDGMREVLPAEWRYPSGNADALAMRVEAVRASDPRAACEGNRALLAERFQPEKMGDAFLAALEDAPACSAV